MKLSAHFQNRTQLYLIILALSLFFLPFRNNISSIFGIILFIFFFIDKEKKISTKLKGLIRNKAAIVTLSIYLLHMIGLMYTKNFKYAGLDLEIKLPLFIIPFVIFSERKLTSDNLRSLINYFTMGNCIILLYCYVYASYRFYITSNPTVLFYNDFSRFLHPSYFSLYIGLNLVFLFYNISNLNKTLINYKSQLIKYLAICTLLLLGTLSLSSKAGILITSSTLLFYAIHQLWRKKVILTVYISSIFTILFMFISLFKNDIVALSRFEQAKNELSSTSNSASETNGSSNSRIEIWKSSKAVFLNNFVMGVGTGDIKDELIKQYKKVNFTHGVEHENNCHNQYLQFFILFGIFGGLLFIFSLIYPTYLAFKQQNTLYIYFVFLFAVNMLVESMLESKAGVEFYALFNAILLNLTTRIEK